MTIAAILKTSPTTRRAGGVASAAGNPRTRHNPNQAGIIAIWAVAANPIISRLPTSSAVANPAATPTAREIRTPVVKELKSEYRTGGLKETGVRPAICDSLEKAALARKLIEELDNTAPVRILPEERTGSASLRRRDDQGSQPPQMIGYRFLPPAEAEMTEASVFYQVASTGLGADFLNDVQHVLDALRAHPALGTPVGQGLRRALSASVPIQPYLFRRG